MNSPYQGKFKVTQQYHKNHDGLDLVGLDSKDIHSTINGKVVFAGWENSKNKKQGFGQFVKIKQDGTNNYYYFGHLSKINVKVGQTVKITQIIGKEGSTGYSTGSHCHYCVRKDGIKGKDLNISGISGIPNKLGTFDDGYRGTSNKTSTVSYYKKCASKYTSLVDALKSISVDSSFSNRSKIAKKNNVKAYVGLSSQNTKLLNLLKQGKLVK